jgi:hypothetical protein
VTPVPDNDDDPIVVFAISGKPKTPSIPKEIPLPCDLDGKHGTNVKKDCAIMCHWPNIIRRSDIEVEDGKMVRGRISIQQLLIIVHFFKSMKLVFDNDTPTGYPLD